MSSEDFLNNYWSAAREIGLLDDIYFAAADARQQAAMLKAARPLANRYFIPASDFTGSLDYIDSLASRRALTLSRRDVAGITTGAMFSDFDVKSALKPVPSPTEVGLSLTTDFRPLGDDRRFDPEDPVRPPRALSKAAARIVEYQPLPKRFAPREWEREWKYLSPESQHALKLLWPRPRKKFLEPNRVVICLKRRIRRGVMHAFGFAGKHYVPRHIGRWSWVVC